MKEAERGNDLARIDAIISYFERAIDLSHFAQDEVAQFHAGKISRISTNEELRKKFKLRRDIVYRDAIQGEGVGEARREVLDLTKQRTEEHKKIIQSDEWAWMIGVMVGGGHNNIKAGCLSIAEADADFLQTVKSTGERTIGSGGTINTPRVMEDGTPYGLLTFYDKDIALQLGDLRRDRWPQTIIDKHPWIVRNNSYLASFVTGIFDTRGRANPQLEVFLSSSYPNVVNFLSELLVDLDVKNPKPRYKGKGHERLIGVGIHNLRDMKVFANQIHSKRPEKEAILEVIRQRVLKRSPSIKPEQVRKPRGSDDDVFSRWLNLKELLGHTPTSSEIQELKKQGKTKYSAIVYINRFGEGSFIKATEAMRAMAVEQGKIPIETQEPQRLTPARKKPRAEQPLTNKASFELLLSEYKKAREICLKGKNRLPTIFDIAELRHQGVINYTAHTLANYFGERSFVQARQRLEELIKQEEEANPNLEVPLPRLRIYARHGKETYNPRDKLIEEYRKAREICLRDYHRLPLIRDIDQLRKQGVLDYTAHTLANYFGDRSYPKAIANLEKIIEDQNKANQIDLVSDEVEHQIFP